MTRVEARQDDRQEFGGKLQQQGRRLRRDGRGWRQEEGAQSVGDNEALCYLLVAVARRGELALAGRARATRPTIFDLERKRGKTAAGKGLTACECEHFFVFLWTTALARLARRFGLGARQAGHVDFRTPR